MRAAVLAAGVLIVAAAYAVSRRGGVVAEVAEAANQAGEVLTSAAGTTLDFLDNASGGILRLSRMREVTPALLNNGNMRAFLRVIRTGEGTADAGGYARLFGGGKFESFADHPRITVRKSGYVSTAAGAYQFIASTWDETRRIMGLPDFSPASQDLAAVGRIAARGALPDVLAGRFDIAIKKVAREWASMPGSPYGQPVISLDRARAVYASAGGVRVA